MFIIESITLPSSLVEIGSCAFHSCSNLREVELNEGLQTIENHSFYNCTSLQIITIPSTVTEIGMHAFKRCNDIREVIMNDGLQKIGDWAFHNCSSLKASYYSLL